MVDSASRPDLLKITLESLLNNVKFSGNINWMFHEAVIREHDSKECIKYVKGLELFNNIEITNPPLGEGYSITKMLHKTKSKYFIHWEDDHEIIREIDLDKCYHLLENYSMINQIAFNKRQTMSTIGANSWCKKNFTFGEDILCVSPHWRISPAIWRLSWILPKWNGFENGSSNNFHWEINDRLQNNFKNNKTADLVANQMGTFYLGPIGELAYVKHIGKERSGRILN
jgi:hypothetical protein